VLSVSIEELATGEGAGVLLADFLRFDSRPTITAVLRDQVSGSLLRLDAVRDLASTSMDSLADLADAYVAQLAKYQKPALIIGFCNASTLALQLAARLDDGDLACLLVDPNWPTQASIAAQYADIRSSLKISASSDHEARDLAQMVDQIQTDLTRALADDGADEEEAELTVESLLPRYRGWLEFLVLSREAPTVDVRPDWMVLGSAETTRPPFWPEADWHPSRFELSSAELLLPGSPARDNLIKLAGRLALGGKP
jgi:pimeloyl-ACP methyl ester carboxylesterase